MAKERVLVKIGDNQERCLECNKAIRTGQSYTIKVTHPKAQRDLKYDTKYRRVHYPDCHNPVMWFEGEIKE